MFKNCLKIALPLAISLNLVANATGPIDSSYVNQTFNNTSTLPNGTFYNTVNNSTTFNSQGDMTLPAGYTLRGLQVYFNNGQYFTSGNGGSFIFNTPGTLNVLGTIDVSASMPGGSGGSIFANVGSMLMGPAGRINAGGMNGFGGTVLVNAAGQIDLQGNDQSQSLITVSGQSLNSKNAVILMGEMVNINGVIEANGVVVNNTGSRGGIVALIAKNGDLNVGSNTKITVNGSDCDIAENNFLSGGVRAGDGGIITLVTQDGQINIDENAIFEMNGGAGQDGINPVNGGKGGFLITRERDVVTVYTTEIRTRTEIEYIEQQVEHTVIKYRTEVEEYTEIEYRTETREITENQGPIGEFIIGPADPDATIFNEIPIGQSITFEVEGDSSNIHGFGNTLDGTVISPQINVVVTRTTTDSVTISATDVNGNTITFFDRDGNSLGSSITYNIDNKHSTHFSAKYQAVLQLNGQPDQVVFINRDFNITKPNKDGLANFVFLPQAFGSDYNLTTTEEVQVPYEVTKTREVQVPYEEVITETVLVPVEKVITYEVQVPSEEVQVNKNITRGNNGRDGKFSEFSDPNCVVCDPDQPPSDEPPISEPPSTLNTAEKNNTNYLLYGLFQKSGELVIEYGPNAMIAFEDPEMFFDPAYIYVGEEILNLAYQIYEYQLDAGETPNQARQTMIDVLLASGINSMVASGYSGKGAVVLSTHKNNIDNLLQKEDMKSKILLDSLSEISSMVVPQEEEDNVRKKLQKD